jgi:hypothetical protein
VCHLLLERPGDEVLLERLLLLLARVLLRLPRRHVQRRHPRQPAENGAFKVKAQAAQMPQQMGVLKWRRSWNPQLKIYWRRREVEPVQ